MEKCCKMTECESESDFKSISVQNGVAGLGIKLSKCSWDPYPFISFIDETREQQHDLQIGDCLLKVNGHDVLGWRIQDIAEQIHNKTDDDNNEVNLLLWRSKNSQGFQPQIVNNLVSDMINILQLIECPICMEISQSSSHTYQCVNGHIVCEKCRWKILRCPTCRAQLGRGRCLVADKILRYLQHNGTIKFGGLSCDTGKNMSTKIDVKSGRRASLPRNEMENSKSSENLHVKSSCLPFKLKLEIFVVEKFSAL